MPEILTRPIDQVQFRKFTEQFESQIEQRIADKVAGLSDEVKQQIEKLFAEQRKAIISAYLPTLRDPDSIEFKTARTDGVFEKRANPQEALLINGKGRAMQMVLTWAGDAQ